MAATTQTTYIQCLRRHFAAYREGRFGDRPELFEPYPEGGPVVFRREHRDCNLLVPPFASPEQCSEVVAAIPARHRHLHFGSMQSSQALAQSVFGIVAAFDRLPLLAKVQAECGRPAFGRDLVGEVVRLEHQVQSLGEPRPTSIDVWLPGVRVAIECKLAEAEFGTCSRPRLILGEDSKPTAACDGNYTFQAGRRSRCALTEVGVRYWDNLGALFGWDANTDHVPCPLAPTYQLVRNILAACVTGCETPDFSSAHALVLYDSRNPAMAPGGRGDDQWKSATEALKRPALLRRLSWQNFAAQWPPDPVFDWLRVALTEKYGL